MSDLSAVIVGGAIGIVVALAGIHSYQSVCVISASLAAHPPLPSHPPRPGVLAERPW